MAKKQEILQELATWVAETVDIAKIIATHNKGLPQEDPAYVVPIDNKSASIKQKTQPYGVKVVVNQSTKRDAVMAKIWEKMSAKNMMERIEEKYIETFKENGITVTVDTFTLSRFADISSGSKSIKLSLQEYNDDGTKRTVKSTGNLADPTKALVIFAKALRTVQGDPHELMSGVLIATNKIYDENSINGLSLDKRNKKLEEICQEIFDNRKKVDGYKEKEAKLIEGDIVNLAKALSISNYINKLLRRNSASNVEVYQTGAKWSKNIAKFKGKDKSRDTIIKSYNSSDLIIKFNLGKATHHWGLSLKKKGYKVNEADPTLLNKPIVGDAGGKKTAGFLFLKANTTDITKLKKAEDNFFKAVYRVRFGEEPKTNNVSWKKKLNDGLAGDEKKAALTGKEYRGRKYPKNTFFEEIDRVFRKVMKDDNNFKELLDLVFRLDIDEYVNQENFHFSLITGIGGLEPNGKIKINKPNEKNSVFLKQVFTSMFQGEKVSNIAKFDSNFKMPTTKGKFQAFDNRATAAKLFYTMFIDSLPIVDLEVRYKGSITAKPQLQVFITRRFNNFLKSAQRKMQNLGVHAYLK
jgi:hypothetical protein